MPKRRLMGGLIDVAVSIAPGVLIVTEQRYRLMHIQTRLDEQCRRLAAAYGAQSDSYLTRAVVRLSCDLEEVSQQLRFAATEDFPSMRQRLVEFERGVARGAEPFVRLQRVLDETAQRYHQVLDGVIDPAVHAALAELGQKIGVLSRAVIAFDNPDGVLSIHDELGAINAILHRVQQETAPTMRPPDDTDHWTVLGVMKGASREEVHAAYHRRMRQYHPDVVEQRIAALTDDPEVQAELRAWFQRRATQLNEAYERIMREGGTS